MVGPQIWPSHTGVPRRTTWNLSCKGLHKYSSYQPHNSRRDFSTLTIVYSRLNFEFQLRPKSEALVCDVHSDTLPLANDNLKHVVLTSWCAKEWDFSIHIFPDVAVLPFLYIFNRPG